MYISFGMVTWSCKRRLHMVMQLM